MKNLNKNAVILMSGGLDSAVAAGYMINSNEYDIKLALTFDYGQKSIVKETEASKKICDYYNINHKVIKLDWLREITKSALVGETGIPHENLNTFSSMKSTWVPNRNALFLNIAAAFCDSYDYKYILFGANKDEGQTFSDNTEEFRASATDLFQKSTLSHPRVIAPLINYTKDDIVKIAVECNVPLDFVWSCYDSTDKHCGKCESCLNLKRALENNHCTEYINILF